MSAIKGAASSGPSGDVHEKFVDKLSVKEFRERFSIPNGVVVELMDGEAMSTDKAEDHAIVFSKEQFNARLRFPLPSLFKEFLHFTKIPPACIHPNIVRVLMGCSILSMLFNLDLSLLEVLFVYSLKKGKNDIFSMVAHLPSLQLVTELPDSTKGGAKGHVLVRGPDKRGHVVEWVEKASFARLNKLFEIAAAERHYETLLTARNLLAVIRESQVYIINILPRKLPKKVVSGEHYVLKDLPFYKEVKKADAEKRRALLDNRERRKKEGTLRKAPGKKTQRSLPSSGLGHLAGLNHSGPSMSAAGRLALLVEEATLINQPGSPHPDVDTAEANCAEVLPLIATPMEEMGAESQSLPSGGPSLLTLVLVKGPASKRSRSARNLKSGLIGRLQDRFQETIEVNCSFVQDDHPEGSETEMATETPAVPVVVSDEGTPGETQPAENEGAPDLEEESPSNASSGGSPVDDAACISAGSFSYAELGRETETDSSRLGCFHAFSKNV
ncbi:hypothetical protein CK203_066156 [Vitis vinifera]|uniref:Uncharacterized protein n=1 Tax=Vitis vinifera TaxID=29760 RepID=A0A438FNX5_VITVI|nr:hypothetical protein CK203_066156 [Vitis vinifera]